MDRPLRVGIDIDDVLNNLLKCWISEWNEISGQHVNFSDCTDWDLHKLIPNKRDYSQFINIPSNPKFYEKLQPEPLAQIIVEELVKSGADVYILTGTYTNQHILKEKWLKTYFPFFPENHIVYAPTGTKHLFSMDLMIDDSPIGIDKYSCQVLLMDMPYNRKIDCSKKINIHRVYSWIDIRNIFVEKYDLLPEINKKIDEYLDKENSSDDLTNNDLLQQLLKCTTKNDFKKVLNPFILKTYDLGYTTALGDIADKIKNMFPSERE